MEGESEEGEEGGGKRQMSLHSSITGLALKEQDNYPPTQNRTSLYSNPTEPVGLTFRVLSSLSKVMYQQSFSANLHVT